MKEFREYLCTACEWTDRVSKDEIFTECPICGSQLTELTDVPEAPEATPANPEKYDPKTLEKAADDEVV